MKICFASQAQHIADPAHVLTEINRILHGKMESSFVTACSIFIDFKSKLIRYSIAGHPPPILLRKQGADILRLAKAGIVLGPFPEFVYENEEVQFSRGDRVVLYTDGLVETKSKTEELFGNERLEEVIKSLSGVSAEASADQIIGRVVNWSGRSAGSSLDDDLTLLVADIFPAPVSVDKGR